MNIVHMISPDQAKEGVVKEVFDEIKNVRSGLPEGSAVNPLWQLYARHPELLKAVWTHMKTLLYKGKLPYELKHKVALIVALTMECEGCVTFHTETLQQELGYNREGIDEVERMEIKRLAEKEYALLSFTKKAVMAPHDITPGDYQELNEKAGLTEEEMVEFADCIALHVGIAVFAGILGNRPSQVFREHLQGIGFGRR